MNHAGPLTLNNLAENESVKTVRIAQNLGSRYKTGTQETALFAARNRHPLEMGRHEIVAFLTALAVERRMSASSQNQALSALLFLYKVVLEREIGPIDALPRARTPDRVPSC